MNNVVTKCCLILFTILWLASANAAESMGTLRLHATGKLSVTPNIARIDISVQTTAKQADIAVRDNAAKVANIVKHLQAYLGDAQQLATTSYHLTPLYEFKEQQLHSLVSGYQVSNHIIVTTDELDSLGALIDKIVSLGVTKINSLQFRNTEIERFQEQALAKAVANGQKTANILAKAAHVKLGRIVSINPVNSSYPNYQTITFSKQNSALEPIEAGEILVSVQVNLRYEFDKQLG